MPFAIHDAAVKKQMNWNVRAGQEVAPDPLPENWSGTASGGLPVKQIPHMDFPRVVYMHPNEPLQEIEHRNDKYELVGTEVVPTEHLTKTVNNEAELKAALEEGWVKEPYIPKPVPKAPGLYGPKAKAKAAK
jgi:hypothetical protein